MITELIHQLRELVIRDFAERSSAQQRFFSGGLCLVTNEHAEMAGIVDRSHYHRGDTLEGGGCGFIVADAVGVGGNA